MDASFETPVHRLRRGFSNPLGLQSVRIMLASGNRIDQFCEDAASAARAIVEAARRPELTIQENPRPSKAYKAAAWTGGAGAVALVVWAFITGRFELNLLFLGAWFLWIGIAGMFMKKVSSRYGHRKLEVALGLIALACGIVYLYQFTRFELSSNIDKGMWYVLHCHRQGARRTFQKALQSGQESVRLSYGLGLLAFLDKDYGQAEKRLKEALRKDLGLNDARYQLSRTYACMGRDEEAKRLLEEYLARGGGSCTSQARHALKEDFGH